MPTSLPSRLDALHARVRANPLLLRLTIGTRLLLAAGFIPTGLVKALGHRFTAISPDDPVGAFFEAMYQTGGYWRFLGWSQVIAGSLLLVPRLAHLGALLFLPIMANIFVVTVALSFRGTPIVTGLMLLAVVYLVCWDYHRWKGLLWSPPPVAAERSKAPRWSALAERASYVLGAVAGLGFFSAVRGLIPMAAVRPCLLLVVAALGLWVAAMAGHLAATRS